MGFFNLFPQIAARMKPACNKISAETARTIEITAKDNAPVDTGFLASSVYSVTPDMGSTYGQMDSPPGDSYALPEMTPSGDGGSLVGVAANYGIYVEMGHHTRGGGSWVPAQPFFYPAVEYGREIFGDEGQKLEAYLAGGV